MIQLLAAGVLTLYIIGVLYHLIVIVTAMIQRKRNSEITWLVDIISRLVVIIDIAFFWPLNLVRS